MLVFGINAPVLGVIGLFAEIKQLTFSPSSLSPHLSRAQDLTACPRPLPRPPDVGEFGKKCLGVGGAEMGLTRAWRRSPLSAADLSSICSNRLQTLNVRPIARLRDFSPFNQKDSLQTKGISSDIFQDNSPALFMHGTAQFSN